MKRLVLLVAGAVLSTSLAAQSGKHLRIIVPFPPGGTSDTLSRMVAERLPAHLDQPVLVENRAGAGGNLAAEHVMRADPDGTTLLSSPPHLLTINHLIYRQLNFDPTRMLPVSIIAQYPNVLLAHPKVPVSSLQELIAHAHKNPGKLSIASQGNGTSTHLSAELFKMLAKVDMLHVPYKGTAPAMADLLGGQVDLMFDNLITAMPHVKSGKLKLLGVGGPKRIDAFPEVPAISEALPGFQSETWMALVAPPGTPKGTVERLSAAVRKVIADPEVRKRLMDLQAEPVGNTPEQMAEVIRQDTERWERVVRAANIRID